MDGSIAKRTKSSRVVLPNYKIGKTLGIGAFGKVKLAHHILTGIKVAVKILERQSIDEKAAEKGTPYTWLPLNIYMHIIFCSLVRYN